jgi:hypothetical protein
LFLSNPGWNASAAVLAAKLVESWLKPAGAVEYADARVTAS